MSTLFFQIQSTLIVLLMFYGVYHRTNRYKHVKTMKTCIIWDLILIVQIELTRGAIAQASNPIENNTILNIHIALALSTVLLYFMMFYTGKKVIAGHAKYRKKHKVLGLTTLTLRLSTFITSFLVL
ncbi:MAG: hypothetical protein N4A33_05205 [Bacteriovoracaceae bacterium]|nr:hypothetical protein [Bacteriovoracaceae bacterium]